MAKTPEFSGVRFIVLLDDGGAIIVQDGRIVKTTFWGRDWDNIIVNDVPTRDGRQSY